MPSTEMRTRRSFLFGLSAIWSGMLFTFYTPGNHEAEHASKQNAVLRRRS